MTYEIDAQKTALLIIDPQREYFDQDKPLYTPHAAEILRNLIRLHDAAHRASILTILVQHSHKADGSDVGRMADFDPTPLFIEGTPGVELIPQLSPRNGDIVVKKTRYSSFVNTKLDSVLKTSNIDTLIITGLMTNYCSVTTARHAHDLDYKVVFVADANAGPDMPDLGYGAVSHADIMRAVATSMAGGIADVVQTDTLIELIEKT